MKRLPMAITLIFLFSTGALAAGLDAFAGRWVNVDRDTNGMTTLEVGVSGNTAMVHAWGKCQPSDCDWGSAQAAGYGANVSANLTQDAQALVAVFRTTFSETMLVMQINNPGRLQVQSLTRFTDQSGRTNYSGTFEFASNRVLRPAKRPARRLAPAVIAGAVTVAEVGAAGVRTILPGGTVEIRYADGTIKRLFDCGSETIWPDGRSQRTLCSQVRQAVPPSLPGDQRIVGWLQAHNEDLLDTIKFLVGNDPAAIQNYLQFEQTAGSLYEKVQLRTDAVRRLVAP